ncbi:MAG: GNAT family N-acetyltransferase [Anaerolineales bacterium]|nr:GNAT family N-acetyltransferase [Anaerolineales bacterium]
MTQPLSLIPIDREGRPQGYSGALPAVAADTCRAMAQLYASVGYETPWVGYLALAGETLVGTCAFKSPPQAGRVEIAYFTFPEYEGHGYASAMAAHLVALAQAQNPAILVTAQTLPERNASHRILEKHGFQPVGTLHHPEAGLVLEWHLPRKTEA